MKTRQTTLRLPEDLADKAELVARTQGKSLNQFVIDSLTVEIDRVREDRDFMELLEEVVARNAAVLESLRDH
ncbi:MAG: YlcI/YnfO family protein [Actinomycetota bacterium]